MAEVKTKRRKPINVLSLGAGVQSSTLLLMSCLGELPKLDAAVFADTKWEPPAVYTHLEWLKTQAADAGIPLHVVSAGDLRKHTVEGFVRGSKKNGERYATMPLRVLNPDGSEGMVRRQCTREYKADPVDRYIRRELLGLSHGERAKANSMRQWFGISKDEPRRIRQAKEAWRTYIYPLCNLPGDYLSKPMGRWDCLDWLEKQYPGRDVPRSSCIGCPYHTNAEWRLVKANAATWADACDVDERIRHADRMGGEVFLHRSCKPLQDVDLTTDVEQGQGLLFGDECLGMCGT